MSESAQSVLQKTVDVPPGTGIDGVLEVLRTILRKGLVQRIVVDIGKVTYYQARSAKDAAEKVAVDLSRYKPYKVVRMAEIIACVSGPPNGLLLRGFTALERQQGAVPVGFLAHSPEVITEWTLRCGTRTSAPSTLCGYPVFFDTDIPDHVVLLCAANSTATDEGVHDTKYVVKLDVKDYQECLV